ncbi:CU044_2847 family protein [Breoghania sp. L-A4]|uniref:CU044_2847 family protein n=1 Tax=Breoghania sp. L-A4 TaxID=2304600 RepID=UPI000E35C5F7|nr:CU044_2847 family protein [Breoghania sp. L-A4]AXS39291.1 hypothetical protein D1F64_03495 [Breoghania sp. L-A4]
MAILKYDTPDGEILIEVPDEDAQASSTRTKGFVPAGGAAAAKAALDEGSFEAAITRVKAAGNALSETIAGIELTPETAELELTLKFVGGAGVVFASASAEAQMKVKLVWKPKPKAATTT